MTLANGFEERNTPWTHSRRRYDAGMGVRSIDDIGTLLAFFEARRGQLYAFRWKDWADFKSGVNSAPVRFDDERIGTGDGTQDTFRLAKTYASGGHAYDRPIAKPVDGSVRVGIDGVEQTEGVDFALDLVTGTVTLMDTPAAGAVVTAGFEFDVPVRFDTDRIHTSVSNFQAGEVPSVPVVEVRV